MKNATTQTELSRPHSIQRRHGVPGGSLIKRLLLLPAVLGIVALGTVVANANDLYNGDLDILGAAGANGQVNPGPDGWTIIANKAFSGPFTDGADSETFCNVQQPGGYGLFFKPFQGSVNLINDSISVYFYQDNPSSPGTKCTLSGYAAGEANYSGFFTTNSPRPASLFVVEFLDGANTVLASNVLDLVAAGLPNGGPASMALLTMPQVTAPANTVTVRAGAFMLNAYGTSGAQSFFVDAFDLESIAPPGSPVITNQPSAATAPLGGTAHFTVGVSNTAGVSYQWQRENADLVNGGGISGATSSTLTITGVSTNNVGHYRVRVSNATGVIFSKTAPLAIVGINFYPVVAISGKIGDTYEVDYATALAPTTWVPFSTNLLSTSPQLVIDSSSPGSNKRFYRAVFLH
ncbi:MAG TPA: immunoglobulin domain-containing protein [Candidatus Acidoferrum sp.]|nr:immunoglobulin domain-containing protein [Candidatus Acidoferrum sp.]